MVDAMREQLTESLADKELPPTMQRAFSYALRRLKRITKRLDAYTDATADHAARRRQRGIARLRKKPGLRWPGRRLDDLRDMVSALRCQKISRCRRSTAPSCSARWRVCPCGAPLPVPREFHRTSAPSLDRRSAARRSRIRHRLVRTWHRSGRGVGAERRLSFPMAVFACDAPSSCRK